MFRITFAIVSAALLIAGCGIHQKNLSELENENVGAKTDIGNEYADCGVIMDDPGKVGDTVFVTMQNGNVFRFENEDGDWSVGNLVAIRFNDNGTPKVYDDIILDYRYAGWISETEIENWIKV